MQEEQANSTEQEAPLYDSSADEAALAELENDLNTNAGQFNENFADYLVEQIKQSEAEGGESLAERFFDSPKEVILEILNAKDKFYDENIQSRLDGIESAKANIAAKRSESDMEAARRDFAKSNPDVNTSELVEFFVQDLPPRIQEQIKQASAEDPRNFWNATYECYLAFSNGMQKAAPKRANAAQEAPNEENSDFSNGSYSRL